MSTPRSEMYVITVTKDMVDYILTISEKSPKKFRYSLLTKMHTACFEAMEYLYEANIEKLGSEQRRYYQNKKQDSPTFYRLSC